MSEILGARSLLYWWGVLTAALFIKDWLKQAAKFFKTSDTFAPDKIPFNILPGLNSWIDGVGNFIRTTINFNPNAELLKIGATSIPSFVLALLLGLLLIAFGAILLRRAIKSSAWFDDFLAIAVMYIILRIVGHIVSLATSLPFANWFRVLVDSPIAAYAVLMLLLLFITFFGEGFQSKRAFWRALIASSLLSLFMYPRQVSIGFGYVLEALALFGTGLGDPANIPFAAAWGVLGMFLAWQKLTVPECGGKGSGGGAFSSDTTQANTEIEVGQS
ncbi:MAG: hypothetical protein L0Y55_17160 [Anaerolineales bacterium]|nr:hypothetical protein [Anaerolineales bacterium]